MMGGHSGPPLQNYVLILFCIFLLCQTALAHEKTLERIGDVGLFLMPMAAMGTTAIHHDGTGLLQFLGASGLGLGTIYALKYTVKRERPNGRDNQSFPSAHTEISFASANFMQRRYGWAYGIPAYLAATFIGYTRVEAKAHWTTDVLAGAAIGIGSGLLFTRPYKKQINVVPFVGDHHTIGIGFRANL